MLQLPQIANDRPDATAPEELSREELEIGPRWLPTPDEILAECARIRAGWNATQLERSTVVTGRIAWTVPTIGMRSVRPKGLDAI